MKRKQLFFAILLMGGAYLAAQEAESSNVYLSAELNGGNYYGINLNLNVVVADQYTFQFGYAGRIRKAKSQPSDYESNLAGFFSLGTVTPRDHFNSIQFCVGGLFPLDDQGGSRLNLSAGLALVGIREPTNWVHKGGGSSTVHLGENYTYSFEKSRGFGLIFNPRFEFPLAGWAGLSVGGILQYSKERTFVGAGFGVLLGTVQSQDR